MADIQAAIEALRKANPSSTDAVEYTIKTVESCPSSFEGMDDTTLRRILEAIEYSYIAGHIEGQCKGIAFANAQMKSILNRCKAVGA
jgi:hypothetical protein